MTSVIKFGTSGWRGLIARDFTFTNVRLAAQGIALYLKDELAREGSPIAGRKPVVIIGHDTRFLGREFSLAVAEVLGSAGLTPLLCERDAPTPVISYTIRDRKAIGGINMTASHNPAEWQGLKFGAAVGAFDGYPHYRDGGWFPALIPTVAYESRHWGLNVGILPSYKDRLYGAITFQFKVRFAGPASSGAQ